MSGFSDSLRNMESEPSRPAPNEEYLLEYSDDDLPAAHILYGATSDAVKDYLRIISKHAVLNEKEEFDLCEQIAAGRRAKDTLASGVEVTPEAQRALRLAVKTGLQAKQQLIDANLRLVAATAKSQVGKGLPLLDLIQEGNFGLATAVDKFDHTRGYKFASYSIWWVRQSMDRAIANLGREVRLPVHVHESLAKIARAEKKLHQTLKREPLIEEVANEVGLSIEDIDKFKKFAQDTLSLATPLDEDGDVLLEDILIDDEESVEHIAENTLLVEQLNIILDSLSEREAAVIRERFGLLDGQMKTLDEIGAQFGVTRERIRQIEVKTMSKLRHPSLREMLRDYLED